jgi:hypothetical protein
MGIGESVVSVDRQARRWRSRPVIVGAALVAVAGVGLGVWSATRSTNSGWHAVTLPPAAGADASGLNAVTVLPDGTAWAVGSVDLMPQHSDHAAIQRWNGHQWTAVPTPALGGQSNEFNGVAASSPSDAWAVGVTSTDPAAQGAPASSYTDSSLIEHWDGTRWTVLDVAARPRLASDSADLWGVAAISATNAWAVGRVANTALIEHWDGARWSVSPSPDLHSDKNGGLLFRVVAVSATDVWALGENSADGQDGCLIEHYDGTTWSVVTCPAPAGGRNARLLSVADISPRDLWAVGYYTTGSSDTSQTAHVLIEHFDGAKWSVVPSPRVGTGTGLKAQTTDELAAVAGRSTNDVYAASPDGVVIHWDGAHWTLTSTRLPGYVDGMSALAGGDIWAVGSQSGDHPAWLANVENP